MKPLRRPGFFASIFCIAYGANLAVGGVAVWLVSIFAGIPEIAWQAYLFMVLGFIPVIAGFAGLAHYMYVQKRIKRLKNEGLHYDAQIVDSAENRYSVRRLDCVYVDERGKNCAVRSRYHMAGRLGVGDVMKAKVYADRNNPGNYETEVFRQG
jgi:hypothetical protein